MEDIVDEVAIASLKTKKQKEVFKKYQKEFLGRGLGTFELENKVGKLEFPSLVKLGGIQFIDEVKTTLFVSEPKVTKERHTVLSGWLLKRALKVLGDNSKLIISKEPNYVAILTDETEEVGIVIAPRIEEDKEVKK